METLVREMPVRKVLPVQSNLKNVSEEIDQILALKDNVLLNEFQKLDRIYGLCEDAKRWQI